MLSDLQESRQMILSRGDASRLNWDPDPASFHYRVYRWWAKKANRDIDTEDNFCHYWRVVMIWAPLRFLANPVFYATIGAVLLVSAGMLLYCLWVAAVTYGLPLVVGLLAVALYIPVGIGMNRSAAASWMSFVAGKRTPAGVFTDVPTSAIKAAVFLPVFTAMLLIATISGLVALPQTRYQVYSRFSHWLVSARNGKWWARPGFGLVIALIALAPFSEVALGVVLSLATIAAVAGFIVWLGYLADKGETRRKAISYAQMLEAIYAMQRPATGYDKWVVRFEKRCRRLGAYLNNTYPDFSDLAYRGGVFGEKFYYMSEYREALSVQQARSEGLRKLSQRQQRNPFAKAVTDYLALLWAVIVAAKWRVCPKVKVS